MAEWNALTWWEQRVYIEGLVKEFTGGNEGVTGQGSEPSMIFSGQRGEMARVGFTEIDLS